MQLEFSYVHFKKSTLESLVLRQKYLSLIHIGGYFTPVIRENETAICKFLFALAGWTTAKIRGKYNVSYVLVVLAMTMLLPPKHL